MSNLLFKFYWVAHHAKVIITTSIQRTSTTNKSEILFEFYWQAYHVNGMLILFFICKNFVVFTLFQRPYNVRTPRTKFKFYWQDYHAIGMPVCIFQLICCYDNTDVNASWKMTFLRLNFHSYNKQTRDCHHMN